MWSAMGAVLLGFAGWIIANFFGRPLLDFLTLRSQVHEEIIFTGNVGAISRETPGYEKGVDSLRRLGARVQATNVSAQPPLRWFLIRSGFDLTKVGSNLIGLSNSLALTNEARAFHIDKIQEGLRLPREYTEGYLRQGVEQKQMPSPEENNEGTMSRSRGMDANNVEAALSILKAQADAAFGEIDFAVMLHETWKPAAYDEALRTRVGRSYAAHALLIVRDALRREMLLALMRIWDTNTRAIPMRQIAASLGNREVIDALVRERMANFPRDAEDSVRSDLQDCANRIVDLSKNTRQPGPPPTFLCD